MEMFFQSVRRNHDVQTGRHKYRYFVDSYSW